MDDQAKQIDHLLAEIEDITPRKRSPQATNPTTN